MHTYELERGPLSRVVEAVSYDLAPALHKRGAHIWIEDIGPTGAVLGFTCWNESERQALLDWTRARLHDHLEDRALGAVTVRDETARLGGKV